MRKNTHIIDGMIVSSEGTPSIAFILKRTKIPKTQSVRRSKSQAARRSPIQKFPTDEP